MSIPVHNATNIQQQHPRLRRTRQETEIYRGLLPERGTGGVRATPQENDMGGVRVVVYARQESAGRAIVIVCWSMGVGSLGCCCRSGALVIAVTRDLLG